MSSVEVWSDFDGTAVEITGAANPRNWSKYPLAGLAGYNDFLKGIRSTGVGIAGVVSRRPDVFIRRMATAWSISRLGFTELPTRRDQIVHTGSEEKKGRFIAARSREVPVGMLEDRPHRLGAVLLGIMTEPAQSPKTLHHPITVGVVAHPRSQEYIDRLVERAASMTHAGLRVSELNDGIEPEAATGFLFQTELLNLQVVQLNPYSQVAGEAFGRRLLSGVA